MVDDQTVNQVGKPLKREEKKKITSSGTVGLQV
jgi:hypothetical protein